MQKDTSLFYYISDHYAMTVDSKIIPNKQTFAKLANKPHELNLEAICVFVATGFFMGQDSYWQDTICLKPGHDHDIDSKGFLIKSKPNFIWHYSPRNIEFDVALYEYKSLLSTIIKDQIGDSEVILPLSGGLDSRSQALILKDLDNPVHAFSYAFERGYPEHKIANRIADSCNFDFRAFNIPKGYLWNDIDELADITQCYSEFTNPRQMAVLSELRNMKGLFSLGHWGDVLFDRGVPEGTQEADVIPLLLNKMVKPKGLELAVQLWKSWGLNGQFKDYLISRLETALSAIEIDNLSAKVRAFKTTHWAHRWTTTNLQIFAEANPITVPYYDNRMCEFICNIPEEFLADRQLQLAHLKQDKSLSKITWQANTPFSINTYYFNRSPYNLPYRALKKIKMIIAEMNNKPIVQRNWELQFVGENNAKQLERFLFDDDFNLWIPKSIVETCYHHFKKTDPVYYAHAVSMLLTLSVWYKKNVT